MAEVNITAQLSPRWYNRAARTFSSLQSIARMYTGKKLCDALKTAGWLFMATSNPPPTVNGVLVVSKMTFKPVLQPDNIPEGSARYIECDFKSFVLIGVYFPLGKAKLTIWPWFLVEAGIRA